MSDFIGKVVLLAGSVGTLGVGLAEDFRAKGATIVIAPGSPVASDRLNLYAGFIVIDGDVGDPADLAQRCKEIEAQHGRLDLVIFCSGASLPQRPEGIPVLQAPDKQANLLRRWREKLIAMTKIQSPAT
jgi:NAD(P)-dependent dehydrogenase (short-subunit alcohol dehydrogenase family)